ncbi:MAG: hypothetical protein GKS03_04320 [Alphaproteobacteria bacterium]|nr:hypothetical protein [Alphaproteobacteria bacterium]
MSRTSITVLSALFFIPLAAWFKDAAVVALAFGVLACLFSSYAPRPKALLSFSKTPFGLFAVLFVLWSLLSLLWAPQFPGTAWLKAVLAIGLGAILATTVVRAPRESLLDLTNAIIFSALALLSVLLIERLSGGFFVGLARPNETTDQLFNVMNGGLVLLCCTSFSVAGLLRLKTETWRYPVLFLTSVLAITASYRMDAVPVAVGAGLVSFILVMKWRVRPFVAIALLIGIGGVSWPTLASLATAADLHIWFAENVHPNWGYRITIWGRVSELISENFLIGYGFDSSRVVGHTAGLIPDAIGRTSFLHPHNGLMQIWLELGLIGVVLLLTTAVSVLRLTVQCSPRPLSLAVAAGTMSASATIWLLSFGVWQGWWLAVLGLTVSAVVLCFRLAGDGDQSQASSAS